MSSCDTARFRGDDADELVAASFACPVCLSTADRGTVALEREDPRAECTCEDCAWSWTVYLNAEQALRLVLRPPAGGPTLCFGVPVWRASG